MQRSEVMMVNWFPVICCALVLLTAFVWVARRMGQRKDGAGMGHFAWLLPVLVFVAAALTVKTSAVVMHVDERPATVVQVSDPFHNPITVRAEPRPVKAPTPPRKSRRPVEWEDPPPPKEPAVLWQRAIETRWVPQDKVWDEAWDEARTWLTHDLNLSIPPTREFVKDKLDKKNVTETEGPEVDGVKTAQIRVDLELTSEGWHELAAFERSHLARDRTETTARGLAILTVLLGALAGYIRLDEWTKGYYTGRLRLATLALVVTAGVAIVAV